jgi:transposase
MRDVAAPGAARPRTTLPGPADEPERRSGYQPAEVRQQLLDAIYSGQPFRTVLRDVGRTSNQVWGFTKTDQEWSERLEAALRQPVVRTFSTAPTLPTFTAVSAGNVGLTSAGGWLEIAGREGPPR